MAENEAAAAAPQQEAAPLPTIRVPVASSALDFASILGIILSFVLIIGAISIGESNAGFFNTPSILIVVFGTITATCIAYTGKELRESIGVIFSSFMRPVRDIKALARAMVDLADIARKRGLLTLSNFEGQTANEPFLNYALRLAVDGYNPEDIERILQQDIDEEEERLKRAASILRRASEIAPAMGLIGTLVGLVKMLANLADNPDQLGGDMALALLTTFYGAILSSIVFAPLAAKLEKIAADTVKAKKMTLFTVMSVLKQENPRNLEMTINSILPPSERIKYFD